MVHSSRNYDTMKSLTFDVTFAMLHWHSSRLYVQLFVARFVSFCLSSRMWFRGELDSRIGLPTYGCVEIDDTNFAMQPPTFMTQGLESLVDESCLSSWYDNYCESFPPTERATLVQAKPSTNGAGLRSYGLNQDFIGTDSNVCFLTKQQYQQNLEKAPEASRRHLSPSSSLQSNTQQFSLNSEHLLESMPNLCLFPQEVLDCLQNPANEAAYGAPVNVGWITEDEGGRLIKKECKTPTRKKEAVQSFVSPPVRAPAPANRQLNSEMTHVAQFADVTGAFHSGLSHHLQPSKLHSTFPSVLRPPKRPTCRTRASKLTSEQNLLRKAKVARYLEKRKRRNWSHTIRYASRKAYAENRPRIKGRFAKQEEVDALKRQMKQELDDQN